MGRYAIAFASTAMITGATACPVCDSVSGEELRQALFGDELTRTLVEVLAPFPVLAVATYVSCRWCLP
jgi:hypothetical protein